MPSANRTALVLLFSVLLWSCAKDRPASAPVPLSGRRVFVVCEGAYGSGNSALTVHLPDSGLTVEDGFRSANGQGLGDVFQSMTRLSGDDYLLCVNNSDRLVRIDGTTLEQTGSLSLRQPRYALDLGNSGVAVTTMYSNKAYIIDAAAMRLKDSIELPYANPEGLALGGGRLWICPWDTACRAIYPYNTITRQLEAPVALPGAAPQSVVLDGEGMIWVLSGNNYKGKESWLTRINPTSGAILKQFRFGTADPLRPVLNPHGDSLYFVEVSYNGGSVNNGVYRMSIHDNALPARPFIAASGLQYFWGVGIDPHTQEIYVGDPLGFTQRGRISVYGADGTVKRTFNSGVGPGQFYFY